LILTLPNGRQLRGDIIKSAILRSDLAPVPASLEAEIRVDDELKKLLAEGKIITAGGDNFRIVKSEGGAGRESQGQHDTSAVKITALLDACQPVAFVRQKSIIKENASLAGIYRATGATLKAIDADFAVPRFSCFVGQTPSFHIARALQEEGGVVRWKSGKMTFFRLPDLFKQKTVMTLPGNAFDDIESGFLERHEVPFFYSLADDGSFVYGNRNKSRTARFVPFKNALRLQNMTRCLITRKVSKRLTYAPKLAAGDLISIAGADPLVIVTAAHAFFSGTDGSGSNQYSRLWLAGLGS
jgi:hypothetical protein